VFPRNGFTEAWDILKAAITNCDAWACDSRTSRKNCSTQFGPELAAEQARFEAGRSKGVPDAAWHGGRSTAALYGQTGVTCGNTIIDDWAWDDNSQVDFMVYWFFFRNFTSFQHGSKRFIEFGDQNGVWASNSRFFERFLGWTGMLVEPVCHDLMS
jgi:hypothetical protein